MNAKRRSNPKEKQQGPPGNGHPPPEGTPDYSAFNGLNLTEGAKASLREGMAKLVSRGGVCGGAVAVSGFGLAYIGGRVAATGDLSASAMTVVLSVSLMLATLGTIALVAAIKQDAKNCKDCPDQTPHNGND
jgi:hypothetical protein